jgi:hypothetical protein
MLQYIATLLGLANITENIKSSKSTHRAIHCSEIEQHLSVLFQGPHPTTRTLLCQREENITLTSVGEISSYIFLAYYFF